MRTARLCAPVAVVVIVLAACTDETGTRSASAGSASATVAVAEARSDEVACPTEGESFDGETKLYIEHNATDEDTGVHGAVDHDGLTDVCVRTPDGTEILRVRPLDRLGALGIGEFSFESREPPADEYSVEDLLADFPEGEYLVSGVDHEGAARVGTALFTHHIPAPPTITEPSLAREEDASYPILPPSGLVVRWEPVTETLDGADVAITAYEVIVTAVEHEDSHGLSRPEYDVHVPPDRRELAVADGFLEPDAAYELEVLAVEKSGNQTISLGYFATSR